MILQTVTKSLKTSDLTWQLYGVYVDHEGLNVIEQIRKLVVGNSELAASIKM